jgi:hypothetical protein
MINAKPNLNGNSEKDFFDAALKLSQAITQVEEALGNMRANVFHGRNYQHITVWQMNSARAGDDSQQAHAARAVATLQSFAWTVANKAMESA